MSGRVHPGLPAIALLCLGLLGAAAAAPALPASSKAPPPDTPAARIELSAAERAWLREHPTLVVGSAAGGWPPYETNVEGRVGGLSFDYLQAMAARLQVRLQTRTYPTWPALFEAACRGEVDVVMNVSITASRTRCLSFTRPYQNVQPALVGRREDAERLRGTPAQMRFVVESGYVLDEMLPEIYPGSRTITVPDLRAALAAVAARQADAYVGDPYVASHLLHTEPRPALAVLGPSPLPPNALHFATPSDRRVLAIALDRALSDIAPTKREKLRARWLAPELAWASEPPLLGEDERQWLRALPPLRVVFDPTWAPLTVRGNDGQMSGILGEYLQRLRDQLGLRLEVVPAQDWREARALIAAGKADIAPAIDGAGYGPQWQLTHPLVTFPCVIVTLRDSDTVGGLDDLSGKRIAVTDPDLGQTLARRLPHTRRIEVASDADGLRLVMQNGADAYIGNLASVDNALRDHRYDSLHVAAPAGFSDRIGLAVRDPYARLVPLFDHVAESMGEDTRQQIRKRWLKVDYDYGFARAVVLWSSAGALAIIALLVAAYLRLRAEIARRREIDTRLREISRNLPAVVFKLRRSHYGEYTFTYVTGNPKPLFGLETGQILQDAQVLFRRVAEADRPGLLAALDASARDLSPLLYEFHARGADGLRWISLNGVARQVVEDGAVHWSGYWVDSTALHEQNEALEQARAAAVAAATTKSNFLAMMSHEIRTPMAGLSGLLELLGRTPLNPSQRQLLATSSESAAALRQILDDVLDFSKAEAGEMRLEAIEVDLRQIACSALEVFAPQAQQKGLALRLQLAPALAATHVGDPFRLRQVLLNLLANAVKFTHAGHVTLAIEVDGAELPPEGSLQQVRLCVADSGVGIAPTQQALLFNPFMQGDATTTRRYGGTGLGLSISRQLVQLMGGELTLESEEGVGTRLTLQVALPVKQRTLSDVHLAGRLVELRIADAGLHEAVAALLQGWGVHTAVPTGTLPDAWLSDSSNPATPAARTVLLQPLAAAVPEPFLHVPTDPLLPSTLQRCLHALLEVAPAPADGRRRVPTHAGMAPILVVEDHPTNRTLVALQLGELGYPHVIAEDGQAALALLDQLSPALLLTDISMPNMDGHTLARRVRQREREQRAPRLPIIAMTANVLDQKAVDTAADIDARIHKPVSLAQLAQVLRQWLPATPAPPVIPATSVQALQLRERMGAHLQPLLRTFLDSTAQDRAAVGEAIERDDAVEVSRRIHRISGALGYFGYTELAISGRDLSHALEQASLTEYRQSAEGFLRQLATVCTELAGLLDPDAP